MKPRHLAALGLSGIWRGYLVVVLVLLSGQASEAASRPGEPDSAIVELNSELETLKKSPASPVALAEESRLLYYLASFSQSDDQRLELFRLGLARAEAARKAAPEGLPGLHW